LGREASEATHIGWMNDEFSGQGGEANDIPSS
jgi:hypothetical protein